jgi:hypothetical protein
VEAPSAIDITLGQLDIANFLTMRALVDVGVLIGSGDTSIRL